jgi:predicted TIM-barrel fold metal-dependent hydrolase
MKRIAVEEHFLTEGYKNHLITRKNYPKLEITRDSSNQEIVKLWHTPEHFTTQDPVEWNRKLDTSEGRLREMDAHGITMQVLSLASTVEQLEPDEGIAFARSLNDELAAIIKRNPDRFTGLAALPMQEPEAAAKELERAVKELGLKGAKLHAQVKGEFIDEKKYWIVFETAEKLDVPVFVHPTRPASQMIKPFLSYFMLDGPIWGFGVSAGLQAIRLIYSGVFDKYPGLKVILGHLGEALPFWLWRMDNRWHRDKMDIHPTTKNLARKPSEYFKENFWVATSGMFSKSAFLCTYLEIGADHILFAVDYPNELNGEAVKFIEEVQICDRDKEKICHSNAEKLFSIKA